MQAAGSWLCRSCFASFLDRSLKLLHQPVEITFEQPVLHDTVLLELGFSMDLCYFGGDLAATFKDVTFREIDKGIQPLGPVFHGHGDFPERPFFG